MLSLPYSIVKKGIDYHSFSLSFSIFKLNSDNRTAVWILDLKALAIPYLLDRYFVQILHQNCRIFGNWWILRLSFEYMN